jgi:hypothetical protein
MSWLTALFDMVTAIVRAVAPKKIDLPPPPKSHQSDYEKRVRDALEAEKRQSGATS